MARYVKIDDRPGTAKYIKYLPMFLNLRPEQVEKYFKDRKHPYPVSAEDQIVIDKFLVEIAFPETMSAEEWNKYVDIWRFQESKRPMLKEQFIALQHFPVTFRKPEICSSDVATIGPICIPDSSVKPSFRKMEPKCRLVDISNAGELAQVPVLEPRSLPGDIDPYCRFREYIYPCGDKKANYDMYGLIRRCTYRDDDWWTSADDKEGEKVQRAQGRVPIDDIIHWLKPKYAYYAKQYGQNPSTLRHFISGVWRTRKQEYKNVVIWCCGKWFWQQNSEQMCCCEDHAAGAKTARKRRILFSRTSKRLKDLSRSAKVLPLDHGVLPKGYVDVKDKDKRLDAVSARTPDTDLMNQETAELARELEQELNNEAQRRGVQIQCNEDKLKLLVAVLKEKHGTSK